MTKQGRDELDAARRQLVQAQKVVRDVIYVLTVEQALLAQRLVKEAGRRGR